MKQISIILLLLWVWSGALAKAPFTEIKAGYQDPSDAEAGYILGINTGRMIDESLSWSFELSYFRKGYQKKLELGDIQQPPGGINPQQLQLEYEYRTTIVPVFVKLNLETRLSRNSPFYGRASGGLGWEMVWNNEHNYISQSESTRFYHGFGWQGAAGIGLRVSSSANIFIDGLYNGSKVKRNQTTNEEGLPTWEELDISGFGVRVGVSIVGFGW